MRASVVRAFAGATLVVLSSVPLAPALAIPPPDRRSLSEEAADTLKALSLKLKLLDRLGADALGIRVSVTGDHALLSGNVAKKASQELAKEVALSVDGIRKVESRIFETAPAGGLVDAAGEVRDATLESRVKLALLSDLGKEAVRIEVEATDGVVSLRGMLEQRALAKVAVQRARAVPGVVKVVDLLRT